MPEGPAYQSLRKGHGAKSKSHYFCRHLHTPLSDGLIRYLIRISATSGSRVLLRAGIHVPGEPVDGPNDQGELPSLKRLVLIRGHSGAYTVLKV